MKRGFTLIELLAVIVILSIIALIAIPSILNIVNDSKIKSLKRSSESYISGVEQAISRRFINDSTLNIKTGKYDVMSDGNICLEYDDSKDCINKLEIEVDGKLPNGGFVDIENNEITYYDVKIDDIYVSKKEYTPEECFEMSGSTITKFICAPMIWDSTENKAIENTNKINNITDVVIPSEINGKKVTVIGTNAFAGNQIKNVIMPNSVTSIGGYGFYLNELVNILLPSNLKSLGQSAFSKNKLTNIIIPKGVSLSNWVFQSNELISVVIPNTMTSIPGGTFNLNKLTSIEIPDSVTSIEVNAFRGNELTNITIPSSVTKISDYAFCDNQLTKVTIKGKSSISDFESYSTNYPFSWAKGYSDSNIIWEP